MVWDNGDRAPQPFANQIFIAESHEDNLMGYDLRPLNDRVSWLL